MRSEVKNKRSEKLKISCLIDLFNMQMQITVRNFSTNITRSI